MAFDKISLVRGTKAEILENVSKLSPYELAISIDTDELIWVDEVGNLHITGGAKNSNPEIGGDGLATAEALKKVYDIAKSAYDSLQDKADSQTEIKAGKGLTGGGTIANNITLNVVASNESIVVEEDGIYVEVVNETNNVSKVLPCSAYAVKMTMDTAVDGVSKANEANKNAENRCPKNASNGVLSINGWAIHIN